MKKSKFFLLCLLAVSLAFGFQSCKKDKDDSPATTTENTTGNDDKTDPVSPTFNFSEKLNSENKTIESGAELKLTIGNLTAESKVSAYLDDEEIEVKDGVIILPTTSAGEHKVKVVVNNEEKEFTFKVLLPVLDFKSVPVLSIATPKFGDDLSVKVNTNLACTVTLKIGEDEISSEDSEGEVSISIPTVVKAGDYTATIIVTDGTTTKQSEINYIIGLPDFVMVAVEGGDFKMGAQSTDPEGSNYDSDAFPDEKPVHSVTLSSYSIGQTEVTQALWFAVTGENPSNFTEKNTGGSVNNNSQLPVESISWNDINEKFLPKLNKLTGKTFRLPTEAEWEYAARGGNQSKGYKYSGSNSIDDVAWYWDNCSDLYNNDQIPTHNVGSKTENELGLYDMSGNVYEWCQDRYGAYGSDAQNNPTGPDTGSGRVYRGGCWGSGAGNCRVSIRSYNTPDLMFYNLGFRLAL